MKLAAIDIGSNSIHMIVATIDGDGNIEVIDRMKEMARLGEETLSTGFLSEEAQQRGLDALHRLKALAERYRCDDIIAVATSATREARNGGEFIQRVREETGIRARIITGIEEGRLIYLGTREVFPFGTQRALIVDIGGGSVEFVLADQRRDYVIKSLKLGVRRIRERFLGTQPVDARDAEALADHVRTRAESVVRAVRKRGFDIVLGTSGTAAALARLVHTLEGPLADTESNVVPRKALVAATERLMAMPSDQLEKLDGIDERRRDTVVAGAILMRTIIEMFGAPSYTFCDAALREGMIVEYLEKNRPGLRMEDSVPDPRRRSVVMLAARFWDAVAHPQTVARHAVRLFDDLRALHRLGPRERELLEFACLLHNVGKSINRSAHHKHSLYIIQHADLDGFTERERLIMANVARYHRRSMPKPRHEEFLALLPRDRDIVRQLATIARLANALDRGHGGNVHAVGAVVTPTLIRIGIEAWDDPALEVTATLDLNDIVHRVFDRRLEVVETTATTPLTEPPPSEETP